MPTSQTRGGAKPRSYTKTQQIHLERMMLNAAHLEAEDLDIYDIRDRVPEAWDRLERDADIWERKASVTLLLDESVAKFFRAMGRGYHARINRVLETYAQMRMAQVTERNARVEVELARLHEAARARREG